MANYPYVGYQPGYYQPQIPNQMGQFSQAQIQPQMPQQPQIMTQIPQTPINQGISNNQGNGIIWVPGYAAAAEYLVAANNAVALWDSNNPYVYLKQADSTGKPTLKVYELVERDPNQQQNRTSEIQLPDLSQFITRDELEDILTDRFKRTVKPQTKKEDKEDG